MKTSEALPVVGDDDDDDAIRIKFANSVRPRIFRSLRIKLFLKET